MMVPMLEEMLDMLADDGVADAVLGMAHRGRLNVIAHVVNLPYEEAMSEFEAAQYRGNLGDDDVMGDVKYHHGATGTFTTSKGKTIDVTLAHNPSHLEAVDPVVEGSARALQTDTSHGIPTLDRKRAVPILIHGDAAFTGQGIVAEVFNMQSLPGYETGGTIHLIANNQIGFTTDPDRRALDALRVGPGQGLRRSDRARQRRRRRRVHRRRASGHRLPARVRTRRAHRPHRLPPLRPQRAGRAGLHAAGDGGAHQEPSDGSRALRQQARSTKASSRPSARARWSRRRRSDCRRRAARSRARWRRTSRAARCRAATRSTARSSRRWSARRSSSGAAR